MPFPVGLDGLDARPVLAGSAAARDRALYFEFARHQAQRQSKWKLVRPCKDGPWQLYDLQRDIGERGDLAARAPGIVATQAARFTAWRTSIGQ